MSYYSSKNAIRTAHHIDGRTLEKLICRPGWPHFIKGKGWDQKAVDGFVIKFREQAATQLKGPDADLRREKIMAEIERIKGDIKLRTVDERLRLIEEQKLRGELILVTEHHAEIQEIAGYFTTVFAQWISEVKVLTGDAKLVAEAERLRDRMLEKARGLIEQNTQKVKQ
jgi:hypothetical protein